MQRLAVSGHSGGGQATLVAAESGLPFRAAIASCAVADRALWYSTFPPHVSRASQGEVLAWKYRYYHWAERGQGDMAAPPWGDPARYTRNSTLYRADRIRCPLLVITGEPDGLSAEALFTALYRLSRPIRVLRYFDEGHGIRGRENFLHQWNEIYRWLDAYVAPKIPGATPAPAPR